MLDSNKINGFLTMQIHEMIETSWNESMKITILRKLRDTLDIDINLRDIFILNDSENSSISLGIRIGNKYFYSKIKKLNTPYCYNLDKSSNICYGEIEDMGTIEAPRFTCQRCGTLHNPK